MNLSTIVFFSFVNMSSTYQSHISGGDVKVDRAFILRFSMNKLAVNPDVVAPIARPSTWV